MPLPLARTTTRRTPNLLAWATLIAGGLVGGAHALPSAESDCCHAHDAIGCEDPTCSATVCAYDPACCDRGWDYVCADSARHLCGAVCDDGCSATCDGDFDNSNTIDARDLTILLSEWQQLGRCSDLDGDGKTGPEDIGYLIAMWGNC